jgi:hypothetical protein
MSFAGCLLSMKKEDDRRYFFLIYPRKKKGFINGINFIRNSEDHFEQKLVM